MSKIKIFFLFFIIILNFVFTSCKFEIKEPEHNLENAQEQQKINETFQKRYKITTYDLKTEDRMLLSVLLEQDTIKKLFSYDSVESLYKDIIKNKFDLGDLDDKIKFNSVINIYYAKEVINFNDNEVRFVDYYTNKEKFITANYIEVIEQ